MIPFRSLVAAGMPVALSLACCLWVAPAAAAAERGPARVAGTPAADSTAQTARVIVRFKAQSDAIRQRALSARGTERPLREAQALSARVGVSLADGASVDERTQVVFASGMSSDALARRLAADADVEWATVDERQRIASIPNDPLYPGGQFTTPAAGQWYLRASSSTALAAIGAEAAWALTTGNPDLVVAVIDTGVRFDHPDLGRTSSGGKLLPGYDFVTNVSDANDGDGRDSDPSDPGDWITPEENASGEYAGCGASNSSWHGTQTAGLIGAITDNSVGMAGVGRRIKVLPVRGLGKCGGRISDIAAAMRWAGGLSVPGVPTNLTPARVINMSLGSANRCDPNYQSAITDLAAIGVLVVAAAGNEGLAVNQPGNCNGALAVAGVRHTGTKVGYSNLGTQVAISAPAGNCVNLSGTCLFPLLTTANNGTTVPGAHVYTDGDVNVTYGTSFASPLVAGTVGLMLSLQPGLTTTQMTQILKSTARAFPSTGADAGVAACRAPSSVAQDAECYCTTTTCGAGLLDAGAAVAAAVVVLADIEMTTSSPTAGSPVTFTAAGSSVPDGRTIASYSWTVSSGSSGAAISGAANQSTVTVLPASSGSFTLTLTIVDSTGVSATATQSVSVRSRPSGGGDDDEGGGSMSLVWMLALAVSAAALRRRHVAAR